MKTNGNDPYNFDKIDAYLRQRKEEIGERKQAMGKIYVKGPKAGSRGKNGNEGTAADKL